MAVTARTWVEGELVNATKMNTLRDDILELDSVAGFNDAQYGTITIGNGDSSAIATVSAMSARAVVHHNGQSVSLATDNRQLARVTKTNSTTITATRNGTTDTTIVSFVVEDPRG